MPAEIRAVIADDEPLARLRLRHLCARAGDVSVVAEATDGDEALAKVRELEPDLLFLDMQMPGRHGLSVAESLDGARRPLLVYVTRPRSMSSSPPSPATGRSISIAIDPAGFGAWDIYAARRCGSGFETPENLGRGINTVDWEYNPSPTPDGDTIAFASNRPSGQASDLYASMRVRGKFTPAWNLGPLVNTAADEYHPTLRVDQNRLYFVRQAINPSGDS